MPSTTANDAASSVANLDSWLLGQQRAQFAHDQRNHHDIHSLPKVDRLKHYGLHYCKYVGRLARGRNEAKPLERTIIDTLLVSLSAANTLHQQLRLGCAAKATNANTDILDFADAAGRFADACEKIDHLEAFLNQAREANSDIINWVLRSKRLDTTGLDDAIVLRRKELAVRQFYIDG